jgi:hypothetical protein
MIGAALLAGRAVLSEVAAELSSLHVDLLVLSAAACLVADAKGAPSAAVDILVGRSPEGIPCAYCEGDANVMIARCLALLPEEHRERAINAVVSRIPGVPPMVSLDLAASLLCLAIPNGAPVLAQDLQVWQRRALEAIRDYSPWTVHDASFANMSELARGYGLPALKQEFADWLAHTV